MVVDKTCALKDGSHSGYQSPTETGVRRKRSRTSRSMEKGKVMMMESYLFVHQIHYVCWILVKLLILSILCFERELIQHALIPNSGPIP